MTITFKTKYGPWALVTGANAGIGKALARDIASRGVNVVAVALRQGLLDQVTTNLRAEFGVQVRTIAADLTTPGAVSDLDNATRDLDIGLVVPNAGMEVSGEFLGTDYGRDQQMLALNVVVPAQMARVFGQRLARRAEGGILLVSSVVGYQGMPLMANYGATKAYILSLGEALNVEWGPQGIDVTVLSPGLTVTDMPAAMPFDFSKTPMTFMTPEEVARIGIGALGRKATVIPGLMNRAVVFLGRFIPRTWPVQMFGVLLRRASKKTAVTAALST